MTKELKNFTNVGEEIKNKNEILNKVGEEIKKVNN
jgi:hypothetical protein